MANEVTETQQRLKNIQVKTSVKMWAAFERWMAVRGHQTLSSGFRAAMEQVTGFNPENQAINSPN